MSKVSFKPSQTTKRLTQNLPDRSRDVIISRYALGDKPQTETLDSIGKRYGITRERVRQIENHAIKLIQESEALVKESQAFDQLEETIRDLGGILTERSILDTLANDSETQNHIYFMLVVGDAFTNAKQDKDFAKRWFVDSDIAKAVESALKQVHNKVRPTDVLSEEQLVEHVMGCLSRVNAKYRNRDTILRWLDLSECLVKNPLNEWGHETAPGIKTKNIRDYAYLAMKRNGSPMHFREVARAITELFGKKAHQATTHNELIKDDRFVLMGRGMYALKEWGYRVGPVGTIIEEILKENGPLTRDEIVKRTLIERHVETNTILVNLQSGKFKKGKDGTYTVNKKK